ncbi:hypothetical protein VN0682_00620 [Helicobacter pylori]|nr:hypothetical protein VN0682_00620 [Helicobacter pylori]
MTKKPARKILSFSTTMRNPKRIGQFLAVLGKFENQILKSSTIMQIVNPFWLIGFIDLLL